MNPIIIKTLLPSLLLFIGLLNPTQGISGDLKVADRILNMDATKHRLASWGSYYKTQLNKVAENQGLDSTTKSKTASLGRRIYKSKNLLAIYRLAFAKYLSNQDLNAIELWLKSPLGKKVYAGIAELYLEEQIVKKTKTLMKRHPVSANRYNLLRSAMKSSQLTEIDAYSVLAADFGIEMVLNGYKALSAREKPLLVLRRVKIKKEGYERQFQKDYLTIFAYIFRKLSNTDIDSYRKFLESTHGVAYLMSHSKAIDITLEKAGLTAMSSAVKNL